MIGNWYTFEPYFLLGKKQLQCSTSEFNQIYRIDKSVNLLKN